MISFNVEPWYDDFDETKHFHKILFKPGAAVQARELTQIQSIIQNQISRFGSSIFKDGSKVLGAEHQSIQAHAIPIKSYAGASALSYFQDKIVYNGTIRKQVVHTETIEDIDYLFVVDKSSGDIVEDSTLSVEGDVTTLVVESSTKTIVYNRCMLFSIKSGVFYIGGYFVKIEDQTKVVSLSSNNASVDVYIVSYEYVKTPTDDESLYDNAYDSPNYAAPGADRYSIELVIETTLPGETLKTNNKNFLITSYRNGEVITDVNTTRYSELEVYLADRTYKESGDYTVVPFIGQVTPHNVDDTKAFFKVDAGDAFIRGFEIKTEAPTNLEVDKARTTALMNNSQIEIDKGPYILVENLTGLISPYETVTVEIHNVINPSTTPSGYSSSLIGTATAFGTIYDSFNTGKTNTYKLFLRDIVTIATSDISNARSFVVKTGTVSYTWSFYAQYSTESYDKTTILGATVTQVSIFNSQNYTHLYKILNTPVKTHINSLTNSTDISYQYYKEFLSSSFTRNGSGSTTGTFSLNGTQFFIGAGIVPSVTVASQWYARVVSVGSGTGTAPEVGSVLKLENGTVNVTSDTTATISLPMDYALTLDVFAVIGETSSGIRTKVANTNGSVTVSGNKITDNIISLLKADCYSLISVLDSNGVDHLSKYNFHTGQTDLYYDHSFISLANSGVNPKTTNPDITSLTINFKYFSHSGTGPLVVDSYTSAISYDEIPTYRTKYGEILRLSDVIDFRPRRTDGSTTLLFDAYKKPHFATTLTTDYEYYLPRIDRVVLTSDTLKLDIIKGIPAKYPLVPETGDVMTLYTLSIPAYTFSYKDIVAEYVDNRRYTMKDISKIDKRVNRLEYYASLSILEKQATDEAIPSDVPGIDKFKNGILVDPFAGHSVGDVFNKYYNCSIDFKSRYLRPAYISNTFYYNVNAGASSNIHTSNNHVVLDYTEVPVILQTDASETLSVQPFAVFNWNGIATLDPPADIWVDTTTKPTAIVNLNGEFDHLTQAAEGNGQVWSQWATTGVGITDLALHSSVSVKSAASVIV